MTEQTIEDLMEEMLIATDIIALETYEPGTPIFNFQQSMIKNNARFRIAKYEHDKQNNNT